jgi:hypothetical protein
MELLKSYLRPIKRSVVNTIKKWRTKTYKAKLCLLIGPESSGTRVFTSIFSEHPLILGTPEAQGHLDILDGMWQALETKDYKQAMKVFPDYGEKQCIMTRRSLPHALVFGKPAQYMDFSDLWSLKRFCDKMHLELVVLITSRSPIPNLASWTGSRMSVERSALRAKAQYHASYCHIFDFIQKAKVEYYMLSLEALILDGQDFVQSVFELLGLPGHPIQLALKEDVNRKYYGKFSLPPPTES